MKTYGGSLRKNSKYVALGSALALVLSACSGNMGEHYFPYETAAPSCLPDIADMRDLDIRISDVSPQANQDFSIEIFRPIGEGQYVELDSTEMGLLVVSHGTGFLTSTNPIILEDPEAPADSIFGGFGLPAPEPTPSWSPSPNPSYASAFPSEYPTDAASAKASVFRQIPTGQVGLSSTFREKIGLPLDVLLGGVNADPNLNTYQALRFLLPGVIAVRCASDAPEVIRAATPIYVNLVDQLSPLNIRASGNGFTGTLKLPTQLEAIGFSSGQMFANVVPAAAFDNLNTPAGYWQGAVTGNGDSVSLFGSENNIEFGGSADFVDGTVNYDINSLREQEPGDYVVFCVFINGAVIEQSSTENGIENLDLDLVVAKSGFFKISVGSQGIESVATFEGDSFNAPSRSVISRVTGKRESITVPETGNWTASRAGGKSISLEGERFDLIESLEISEVTLVPSNNSSTIVEFRVPKLAVGDYQVFSSLTDGRRVFIGNLKVIEAPKASKKYAVTGFNRGKAVASKKLLSSLGTTSKKAIGFTNASCSPQAPLQATAKQLNLSKARAEFVCDQLKITNPELTVKVSRKQAAPGSSQVFVKLSYK